MISSAMSQRSRNFFDATSSSSYLKLLIAKFPFIVSNTSSSFFFSPQYRHSFHSRQARNFFTQTTTSTLFTSQRFCSTATSPQQQQQQPTNEKGAASATKNSIDRITEERYFNDAVIKHVVAEVSKNKLLKDVFQEIDRALTGINENNKIERCDLASRYEKFYKELSNDGSTLATNYRAVHLLIPLIAALDQYNKMISKLFNKTETAHYSLLFGTIYFLRAFANHSPRITVSVLDSAAVIKLDAFTNLSLVAFKVAKNTSLFHYEGMTAATNLIVSTLQKVERVETARIGNLPEIARRIEAVHKKLSSGALQQQCEFASATHSYFACSSAGVSICAERFVNPKSKCGITNCFERRWNPNVDGTQPEKEHFRSDIVNIVAGSSGSGKTISSLIASASSGIPVYNILLHTGKDDIIAKTTKKSEKGPINKKDPNDQAFERLIGGILAALERSNNEKRGDKSDVFPPLPSFAALIRNNAHEFGSIFSSSQGFAPAAETRRLVLRIVVDEIGSDPEFLRALCAVWPTWRVKIAEWLGVSLCQLQLVAVGSGLDNFELAKQGAMKDSYRVLIVARNEVIFKKLFQQQLTFMNSVTQRPPAERLFEMLFGEKADPNALHPSFPRSQVPMFCALRRLVTNPRCAAIILSLMHQTFVTNMERANASTLQSSVIPECTEVQLRATVSYWCVAAVAIFCSKSSLANMSAQQRHYALGKAVAYDLNRSLRMDGDNAVARAAERKRYAVFFGLLLDTARAISASAASSSRANFENRKTPETKPTMRAIFDLKVPGEPTLTFGVPDDEARFQVDDAFVMMYLIMSETVSNGVFAKSYSNVDLLFKEAVFDFQRLAVQFGQRHPVPGSVSQVPILADGAGSQNTNSSAASSRFEAKIVLRPEALIEVRNVPITPDAAGFTSPHLLFGLGCDTVHSANLSFKLEESTLENAVIPPAIQLAARIWREKVHQGHAVALLNGASATMADTIILAQNRIILTQCKHGEKIDSATIHEEIFKMRRKKLLSLLCWCVATSPKDTEVEVFYVIAGGDKKNINTSFPNKASCSALDSTIKMEGTTISFDETKIHQVYQLHESIHFTYAFDGDSKKTLPYSPILRSKLPSSETVCDCYTTMKHVVQLTSINKSSCSASEMLATKLTKN